MKSGFISTVTAVLVLGLLWFIGLSVWNRNSISHWGRRSVFLLGCGLVTCCFAAARDGLDRTIQYAVDGSCAPGAFPLVSVPTLSGCIGAGIILTAAIATLIARSQHARQLWFYVMSAGTLLKIVTVEAARLWT